MDSYTLHKLQLHRLLLLLVMNSVHLLYASEVQWISYGQNVSLKCFQEDAENVKYYWTFGNSQPFSHGSLLQKTDTEPDPRKSGDVKRINVTDDETDKCQEEISGEKFDKNSYQLKIATMPEVVSIELPDCRSVICPPKDRKFTCKAENGRPNIYNITLHFNGKTYRKNKTESLTVPYNKAFNEDDNGKTVRCEVETVIGIVTKNETLNLAFPPMIIELFQEASGSVNFTYKSNPKPTDFKWTFYDAACSNASNARKLDYSSQPDASLPDTYRTSISPQTVKGCIYYEIVQDLWPYCGRHEYDPAHVDAVGDDDGGGGVSGGQTRVPVFWLIPILWILAGSCWHLGDLLLLQKGIWTISQRANQ